jgi:hypothetical protein
MEKRALGERFVPLESPKYMAIGIATESKMIKVQNTVMLSFRVRSV